GYRRVRGRYVPSRRAVKQKPPTQCGGKTRLRRGSDPRPVGDVAARAVDAHPRAAEAAGAVELDPREAVVVADDHRHGATERVLGQDEGEIDLHREGEAIARG